MSCYDWESGTITIPAKAWPAFKKALRDGFNKIAEQDLVILGRIHAAVTAAIKGQRLPNLQGILSGEIYRTQRNWRGFDDEVYPMKLIRGFEVESVLLVRDATTNRYRLKAPRKSDLPFCNSKTVTFQFGEARISLDDASRQVRWDVPENNHACEEARSSAVGELFFGLLAEMDWTRGSGGYIVGNDEYNQDDSSVGGGANRINSTFGPLGEKERQLQYRGLR